MTLKEHILTTAIELFARNGIKRVSMDDIANKSGVSKRTLYEFFNDKESMIIETLHQIGNPYIHEIEFLEKNNYTALEIMLLFNEKLMENQVQFCDDFFEDIKRYPKAYEMMIDGKKWFVDKINQLFKRGVKEDVFLANINYDIISSSMQEKMNTEHSSELSKKYTHEEVHNTMFFILIRGICTKAGQTVLESFVLKKQYKQKQLETN